MNKSTLFVIGDENAVLGFGLLGVEGCAVDTLDEAHQALADARSHMQSGILFITEEWADALRDEVDQLKAVTLEPLILEVPASQPRADRASLRMLVQNALGIHLDA
jgi:V/A-type H+-transporting ATPase subunit F